MADSPLSETLDDFLADDDDDSPSDDDNEQSTLVADLSPANGLKLKISKRKHEPSADGKEQKKKKKKKSKSQPSYMRRNIRNLLTNDKLQGDTLSALKAEQDRLKRLEEINQQLQASYTHLPTHANQTSTVPKSNAQECIVIDDDDDDDNDVKTEVTGSAGNVKIDAGLSPM